LQLQLASPLKTSKKKSQKKYSEISSSSREQQKEKLRNLRQGTKKVREKKWQIVQFHFYWTG
jgi:hypothetical protein